MTEPNQVRREKGICEWQMIGDNNNIGGKQ